MRLTFKHLFISTAVVALGAGTYLAMRPKTESAVPKLRNPVQTVKTVIAEQKSIPVTINVNGNVSAINTVDVRPQIQNIVRAIHVSEGQEVQAGQLLFTLDAR